MLRPWARLVRKGCKSAMGHEDKFGLRVIENDEFGPVHGLIWRLAGSDGVESRKS